MSEIGDAAEEEDPEEEEPEEDLRTSKERKAAYQLLQAQMKKRAEEEDETDEADEDDDDDYRKSSKDDPHTCFSASATVAGSYDIGADINIKEYLDKHPNDNFIIEYNTKRECQSLSDLKKQFSEDDPYGIYYECSATLLEKMKDPNFQPWGYGIDDYYTETEYAKVGSTNFLL